MATEAQIKANRQNALKSTGPRTPEGKQAASQNALKHGLCANKNVIKSESLDEYNLFHDEMLEDLSPVGAAERMLAERIVSLSWRLKRAEHFQNAVIDALIDDGLNDMLFGWSDRGINRARSEAQSGSMDTILGIVVHKDFANSKILEQLLVYERRIESSLYKTAAELRKIQRVRQNEEHRTFIRRGGQDTEKINEDKDTGKVIERLEIKDCRDDFQSSRNDGKNETNNNGRKLSLRNEPNPATPIGLRRDRSISFGVLRKESQGLRSA